MHLPARICQAGPLNDSIIADVTRHISGIIIKFENDEVVVLPGTFYRDFLKGNAQARHDFTKLSASKGALTTQSVEWLP